MEKFTNRVKWKIKIPARIFLFIGHSKKLGGKISKVATVIRKSPLLPVEDFTARLRKFLLLLLDKSRASGTRFEGSRLFQFFTARPPRETNRPIWRSGSRTNDPTSGVSASLRIETYPTQILSVNGAVFHPLHPDRTTPIHSKMSLTRAIAVVR